MTTAVDSSILLDVFTADPQFGAASEAALAAADGMGSAIIAPVGWAEVRAFFGSDEDHARAMAGVGVRFSAAEAPASSRAGALWRDYRKRHGSHTRGIPDFLIGAHALLQADALLTRDRGFYRTYFSSLRLIEP